MSKDKADAGQLDQKQLQEKENQIIKSSNEILKELFKPREGLRVPGKQTSDDAGQDPPQDVFNLDIEELQKYLDQINEQLREIEPLEQAKQDLKLQELKEQEEKLLGQEGVQQADPSSEHPMEYYLQWEPFTAWERARSYISNTYEIWYVLFMIIMSVLYPSLSGLIMLVTGCPLVSTMTCNPNKRYFRAQIVMIVQVVAYIILVILRLRQKKHIKDNCTFDEWKRQKRQFEFLGLDYNETYSVAIDDGSNLYHFSLSDHVDIHKYILTASGFIISFIYIFVQRRKIEFLTGNSEQIWKELPSPLHPDYEKMKEQKMNRSPMTTNIRKDIEYYKEITKSIQNQQENAVDVGIGTKKTEDRDQKDREEMEINHKRMLGKKIPKNYIDSTHFYAWNSTFFSCCIVFQLMGAMACNSASDLPSIIAILTLASLYPFRKSLVLYRKMCFYTVYWIVGILLFKIIFSNFLRMGFVQDFLRSPEQQESFFTQFLVIFFGGIPRDRKKANLLSEEEMEVADQMLKQKILYFCCIFCGFAWKSCKWIEIRMMTADLPESASFYKRWCLYFDLRQNRDTVLSSKMSYMREKMDVKKQKESFQKMKNGKNPKKFKKKTQKMRKPSGQIGKTDYLPDLVIWTSRILMFVLSYTYHTYASLISIIWIVFTFVFPQEIVFLFSAVVMLPIIFIQFMMVYGIRLPVIKDRPFFKNYGNIYIWDMASETIEQSLMYCVLLCFFMFPSCYAMISLGNSKNKLLAFFETRCLEPKYSNKWKYIFFSMRYIQSLMLGFLFFRGFSTSINNLQNLGYMIFFVIYTAYEKLYRQTSWLLCLFTAFFIIMQYFVSLQWQLDQDYVTGEYDSDMFKTNNWANIIPFANSDRTNPFEQRQVHELPSWCQWAKSHNQMYCEYQPSHTDWIILLFMGFLQDVNTMYKDKDAVAELERKVGDQIKAQNHKQIYYLNRAWRVIQMVLGVGIQIILICLISRIQINLINWIFFIQTTLLVALKLRASTSYHALCESYRVAQSIKLYSLIVLISNIMFICFVGFNPEGNVQKTNLWLKVYSPWIYDRLDLIGFRSNIKFADIREENEHLKWTYLTYVVYFLVSIYICDRLDKMRQTSKQEEQFGEEDYKRMFEAVEFPDPKLNVNINEGNEKFDSIYIKREQYSHEQLEGFYEGVRFTIPFILYRRMNQWPILDTFAQYGHLINNGCIVYAGIFISVSVLTCFQIGCVCFLYCASTLKINWAARKGIKGSGIQGQCDIKMVQMITKKYKIDSFNITLQLRRKIARIQYFVLLMFIWLSFPTAIIQQYRNSDTATDEQKQRITDFSFWLFITGIYRDIRPESEHFFNHLMILLSFGIIVEKFSIGWLKNRNGCTHFKLQKFIELDMRREALRKPQWEVCLPAYSIENYRQHYFLNDFEWLMYKIMGNLKNKEGEFYVKQPIEEQTSKAFGDFVPYKSAIRIKDMISFSVKFDCGSRETRKETTDEDFKILKQKDYDYEAVSVLRKFKTEQLEKIISSAIDLKYKVSLAKGAQLFLEVFMISLCMLSCILKSNLWSWIYIIFVLRSVTTNQKTNLLVSMNSYIAILFMLQYVCFLLNLSSSTSPAPFPEGYRNHPKNLDDPNDFSIRMPIPLFFHYPQFRDLATSYSIGLGVDRDQLVTLIIDFINLYTINVYTLTYKNPILRKEMRKVFWQFPTPDNAEQWSRLDKDVQKQVAWLFDPKQLKKDSADKYQQEISNYPETTLKQNQIKHSNRQYEFALQYNQQNQKDLNDYLTTYVDLKYQDIWAEETLKKIKNEFKHNSSYFRLVKQGSMLVYITFHIFTIAVLLMAGALRQSFLGLGYAVLLLPRFKDGAEVLNQRAIAQQQKLKAAMKLEEELQVQIKNAVQQEELDELKEQLHEVEEQLNKMSTSARFTTVKEKEHQEKLDKQLSKGWPMITAVKKWILIYGLIDFTLQMYFQMPRFALQAGLEHQGMINAVDNSGKSNESVEDANSIFRHIGLRKIWTITDPNDLNYEDLINSGYDRRVGMEFNQEALVIQCLNVIILSIIMLQSEIFDSTGYKKFVTQADGSMDLLMQLSGLKAKSTTYIFNNQKVRKVVSIQRQKETIMQTVEKYKEKLIRWRKFTRTSLGDENIRKRLEKEYAEKAQKAKEEADAENQVFAQLEKDNQSEDVMSDNAKFLEVQKKKSVRFDQDEDPKLKQPKILNQDEKELIINELTKEFVKAKQKKLRCCASYYNWLNQTFTEQLIFKNRKEQLEQLTDTLAKGEVYVPTELEVVMQQEAEYLIRGHFDNINGNRELSQLFNRKKGKQVADLIELTQIDKKIKLNQMRVTWNFTRTWPLIQRLIETVFHIIISQTQNLIYLSMVFSMYQNAGLISVFYPIMAFGWGMVNETRPKKEYWRIIRLYTTFLLLAKFIFNLAIMEPFIKTKTYIQIQGYSKLGFFDYPGILDMLKYMSPEILIISLIMLNEIKLKLCGIYFQIEGELETVQEAIDRQINNGDEEIIRQNKLERANMCMTRYFDSASNQMLDQNKMQFEILKDMLEEEKVKKNNVPLKPEEVENIKNDHQIKSQISKAKQEDYFDQITKKVFQTSKEFDIDQNASAMDSHFDQLVSSNVIQKSLESDSITYVEGARLEYQPEFVSAEQMDIDIFKPDNWESWSDCDYPEKKEKCQEEQEKRTATRPGFFEKSAYIDSIFPSLKIQKPGRDFYGSTTCVLLFTVCYVFVAFKHFTVDPKAFVGGETNIFNSEMAITLVVIILITMIERIASRTDTKKASKKVDTNSIEGESSFFNQSEMFKRTSTARSMTVALKTMKTGDIDMQSDSAQEFLSSMYGGGDGQASMDTTRTKITVQQKLKFVLHWFIIIFGHFYIFWYIPITGNMVLYNQPNCNYELKEYYGCKNFHNNPALKGLYLFLCMYMCLSAIQLSYGFPIMRKPSSVLNYDNDLAKIGSDVFAMIPFLVELRCLIDFTFHKTSLDMFQTMALYMYHFELYSSKIGNNWYNQKALGSAVTADDKCIFGVLMTSIILTLIVGPLILFSNLMPGLVTFNPVLSADVHISFNMNKTIYSYSSGAVIDNTEIRELDLEEFTEGYANGTIVSSTQSTPYLIYNNANPFFRVYNEKQWQTSNYSEWTETNYMKPQQVQRMQANDFSDTQWDITNENKISFMTRLMETVNHRQDFSNADTEPILQSNFSVLFDFAFTRDQPADALTTHYQFERKLNYSKQTDCLTGIQIQNIITKPHPTPEQCNGNQEVNSMVMFRQTYMPNLVLGKTGVTHPIDRQDANDNENYDFTQEQKDAKREAMQKHDVALVFKHCSQTWGVFAKLTPTEYSEQEQVRWNVNSLETCAYDGEVLNQCATQGGQCQCQPGSYIWFGAKTQDGLFDFTKAHTKISAQASETPCETSSFPKDVPEVGVQKQCFCEGSMSIQERLDYYKRDDDRDFHSDGWGRLHATLFSLMVSASFLAAYSPTTFYAGIAYVAGGQFRVNFIISTFMASLYEVTESKGIIKLFEAVYIHRHEQNLREEEEVYRMIVEIYRSPELFKALTGSTLKGDCDPKLDKMDPKTKEKLLHLEKLEDKGFDVEELKTRLLAQRPDEEKDDSEKQQL